MFRNLANRQEKRQQEQDVSQSSQPARGSKEWFNEKLWCVHTAPTFPRDGVLRPGGLLERQASMSASQYVEANVKMASLMPKRSTIHFSMGGLTKAQAAYDEQNQRPYAPYVVVERASALKPYVVGGTAEDCFVIGPYSLCHQAVVFVPDTELGYHQLPETSGTIRAYNAKDPADLGRKIWHLILEEKKGIVCFAPPLRNLGMVNVREYTHLDEKGVAALGKKYRDIGTYFTAIQMQVYEQKEDGGFIITEEDTRQFFRPWNDKVHIDPYKEHALCALEEDMLIVARPFLLFAGQYYGYNMKLKQGETMVSCIEKASENINKVMGACNKIHSAFNPLERQSSDAATQQRFFGEYAKSLVPFYEVIRAVHGEELQGDQQVFKSMEHKLQQKGLLTAEKGVLFYHPNTGQLVTQAQYPGQNPSESAGQYARAQRNLLQCPSSTPLVVGVVSLVAAAAAFIVTRF